MKFDSMQIAEKYAKLYEEMKRKEPHRFYYKDRPFQELVTFLPTVGKAYSEGGFMVIGRAPNDWDENANDTLDQYIDRCKSKLDEIQEKGQLSWLNDDYVSAPTEDGGDYTLSRSSFWRTTKQIFEELIGEKGDKWIESIAWSNIYKVAPGYPKELKDRPENERPQVALNPTAKMINCQMQACRNIMKTEIEIFRPSYLLFVIGNSWWEKFAAIDDGKNGGDKNTGHKFVERTFFIEKTKCIVSCRPERKPEKDYSSAIIDAFRNEKLWKDARKYSSFFWEQ